MKKMIEEYATRFSHIAVGYDGPQDSDGYRTCVSPVVHYADPSPEDVVFDLGTGTGVIALVLAPDAKRVVGRDISKEILEQVRAKAAKVGVESVEFDEGRSRGPNVDDDKQIDIVMTSFVMHHLSGEEKREAIGVVANLEPRWFVFGGVMFLGMPDPDEPSYSPEMGDPVAAGLLAGALTDAGLVPTAVESVYKQVGVLAAERVPTVGE